MSVRLGCAMWANKDWIGALFPAQAKPAQLLSHYQRHFGAVEGNTTFYGLPAAATVQRWRADTSEDFRFLFKVPRTITHDRRLRDADEELRAFCARLEPLGPRLGPTSIQLPASFGPDRLEDLRRFLGALPRSWPWSVEVRHRDFFNGGASERALNDLLYERGVDRVLLDSRALFSAAPVDEVERVAHGAKPQLPVRPTATAERPVVRFIGHRRAEVSAAHWQRWLPVVGRWLAQGRSPTLFFHTADNVDAPAQALRFAGELLAHVPEATITTGWDQPSAAALDGVAHDEADRPAPATGTLPFG